MYYRLQNLIEDMKGGQNKLKDFFFVSLDCDATQSPHIYLRIQPNVTIPFFLCAEIAILSP